MEANQLVTKRIEDSISLKQTVLGDEDIQKLIISVADEITYCIKNGGKIMLCGNGGSASDALHFAGEIVGRFERERAAWPAVVLNSDVATMTAISNDYGYDDVFARQAEAHVNNNDFFIGISTSGNSENVYRAICVANKKNARTAALLGKDGGKIAKAAKYPIVVPGKNTARIQECHIMIIHIICELLEMKMGTE